jgi:alcohol dehydrogenase (cytochrome c)
MFIGRGAHLSLAAATAVSISTIAIAAMAAGAPATTSVAGATDGWYSTQQAAQGATLFQAKCAVCHGAKLQGGAGPALVGKQFFLRFGGKPVSQLWYDVHTEMPLTAPSSLPNADSLAIIAFILQQNGFPAGASPIVGHYDTLRPIPNAPPGATAATANAPVAVKTPMVVRQPTTSVPTQTELDAGDTDAGNWLTYGKGYRGARYSSLADIPAANAAQLKPLCSVELAPGGSFEGSPVAYDAFCM